MTLRADRTGVRLQKLLSTAGVASRRAAETLIRSGRVTVNGRTVSTLGSRADPERDDVRVDGRRTSYSTRRRYLLVYKPRGYVTTRSDPQRRRTVLDLIPGTREYVYPVGRLDYDSEGLLLLTNDGDLAARLMHPRHGVERVYEATVRGVPSDAQLRRLSSGVLLGRRRTAPVNVRVLAGRVERQGQEARVRIVLREGRNRQIRRMLEVVGHSVKRLRRIQIGPIRDRRLKPGQFRDLLPSEVAALRRAATLTGEHGLAHRPSTAT